jgi:hypothetical protein
MAATNFSDAEILSMPYRRGELILYLEELQLADPRPLWRAEEQHGLISGIDQVFHFFFDDNEFNEGAIGATLLNRAEVEAIATLKAKLDAILSIVGNRGDDVFVEHPLWPKVSAAASHAFMQLTRR